MKTKRMTRRDSRILVLRVLFSWNVGKINPEESFDFLVSEIKQELMTDAGNIEYAKSLVNTIISNIDEIDEAIDQVSVGWPVSRMPKVDLSILRLAYTEGAILKGAPVEVVVDEAVELAKQFSSHASPKFINGVLMGLFRKVGWSKDSENRYNN